MNAIPSNISVIAKSIGEELLMIYNNILWLIQRLQYIPKYIVISTQWHVINLPKTYIYYSHYMTQVNAITYECYLQCPHVITIYR
jgi:hypothetical protein